MVIRLSLRSPGWASWSWSAHQGFTKRRAADSLWITPRAAHQQLAGRCQGPPATTQTVSQDGIDLLSGQQASLCINPREGLLMFNDVYPLLLARISNGGYAVTGLPIWYVCFFGGLGVRTSEKAEKRRANPSLIYQTRPNTMRAENNSRAVQSWEKDEARACFEHAGSLDNYISSWFSDHSP